MKIKELIEILEMFDGEGQVILSSDREGNKHSLFGYHMIATHTYTNEGIKVDISNDSGNDIVFYPRD